MSAPALIGLTGTGAPLAAAALSVHGFRVHDASAPARQSLTILDPLLPSGRALTALVSACGWDGAVGDRTDGPEVGRLLKAMRAEVPGLVLGGDAWLIRVVAEMSAAADLLGGTPVAMIGIELPAERAWVREHGGVLWHAGPGGDPEADVSVATDCSETALGRRVERELTRAAHPLTSA